jgi:membrane protein YqaA with SNARE-associated domain
VAHKPINIAPTESVPPAPPKRQLRLIQILTITILIGAFAGTIYLLGDPARRRQLEELIQAPSGLLVLFAISAISNATLILPVPGLALTALAATVADPLVVGFVAGAGQTVGELTGYLAGYSGQTLVDDSPRYTRLVGWMRRFGVATIFVLGLIPNPLFDIAGIIAGALRMPIGKYLVAAGAGKIIKNIAVAYGAALGIEWLMRIFGG